MCRKSSCRYIMTASFLIYVFLGNVFNKHVKGGDLGSYANLLLHICKGYYGHWFKKRTKMFYRGSNIRSSFPQIWVKSSQTPVMLVNGLGFRYFSQFSFVPSFTLRGTWLRLIFFSFILILPCRRLADQSPNPAHATSSKHYRILASQLIPTQTSLPVRVVRLGLNWP